MQDKYDDESLENIDDMKILTVKPLQCRSPFEIVELFGGKIHCQQALAELENEIYKMA